MKIINSKEKRQKLIQIENELFNLNKEFPDKIFSTHFNKFVFTTFEDVFYETFFKALKNISKNDNICLGFIAPAFLEEDIGHVEINPKLDNEDDYVDVFQSESKDKPSWPLDTMLITIMDKFIIYPKTQLASWVAYGERKTDITVLGFTNEKEKNIFKNTHDNVLTYNEICDNISMEIKLNAIEQNFLSRFKKNYS